MRTEVINRIKALAMNGVRLSEELPYDESGVPRYLKNTKTLYVDRTQYNSLPIVQTLQGVNINNTTESVSVYLAVDAKNPPQQLDTIIDDLRGIEDTIVLTGAHTRESTISTDYVDDLITVQVEYRLTKLN
jgi:hypothetical protein